MSNYFDNQSKWAWNITEDKVQMTTDHGNHTHTLDITDATVGDMLDNPDKVMGDAHRAASHDFKEEAALTDGNPQVGNDGIDGGMDM